MSPPSCEAVRRLVPAYVDGELVGGERKDFEAHVAGCDGCRRAQRDEEAASRAVREAFFAEAAPETLRVRVRALLEAASAAVPAAGRRHGMLLAAAAVVAIAVAGAFLAGRHAVAPSAPAQTPAANDLAALAADTHLRYTRGQLPLEIGSDKPEAVSRWFAGRVPFNLALPDYPVRPGEQKFYRLEGGRLVAFGGDYAAYVAYRMDDRPISLIVTSADLAHPEGGETVQFHSLVFHQQAVQGLKVITWTDKGLTYALASDLSVRGERSCMVCHGSPEERQLIEGFSDRPRS
jgi:anti-sigma factor (TIGR02949 family)